MFDYITVQEAAKKWAISERRIQKLCEENRIPGVVRLSRVWLIPIRMRKNLLTKDVSKIEKQGET